MRVTGKHSWLKHLDFIVIDLASLAIAFVVSFFLRFGSIEALFSPGWQGLLGILLLLNLTITFLMNPYSGIFRRAYYEDLLKMILLSIYSFICACVFFYIFKMGEDFSRLVLVGTYTIYFFLSFALKYARKRMLLSGKRSDNVRDLRNIFVVTTEERADETIELILSGDFVGCRITGLSFAPNAYWRGVEVNELVGADELLGLDRRECEGDELSEPAWKRAGLPVVPFDSFAEFVIRKNIDDVFIGVDPSSISSDVYELLVMNEVVVQMNVESITGIQSDVQSIERTGVYKTLNVGTYTFDSRQWAYSVIKRIFDVILGFVGCVLLLPVMAVTKIWYLAHGDNAPIVYRQTRIGLRGKPFQMFKLRSMVANADEVLEELLKDPVWRAEWDENQKFEDDPRITGIGHVLRKTSLDEFPQFINVVKGDMSIVGPRPLVEGELEAHGGLSLYNKVKPGVTGWWGCNGRSNISYRERLELEYHYVKHCSLYLDMLCILRTFSAVLKRDGAK